MDGSAICDPVNCPICFEIFKEPLILRNCGHSVCSQCVDSLIKASTSRRRTLVCPVCRTASKIPAGGFKKNYSLAGKLDPFDLATLEIGFVSSALTYPENVLKLGGLLFLLR